MASTPTTINDFPIELVSKICSLAGIGIFPALKRVSRSFRLACIEAEARHAEAVGYPAQLDHYSHLDLIRHGHVELFNIWAAGRQLSDKQMYNICIAASEGGCLDIIRGNIPPPSALSSGLSACMLKTAARRGYMHIVSYIVPDDGRAVRPDAFAIILKELTDRKATYAEIQQFEYLVTKGDMSTSDGGRAALESARVILTGTPTVGYDRPPKELFMDFMAGGHLERARELYDMHAFELDPAEVGLMLTRSFGPGRTRELQAWVLSIIADIDDIDWFDALMECSDPGVREFVLRATFGRQSPYKPHRALERGFAFFKAYAALYPEDVDLSLASCRDRESVQYCVAKGCKITSGLCLLECTPKVAAMLLTEMAAEDRSRLLADAARTCADRKARVRPVYKERCLLLERLSF